MENLTNISNNLMCSKDTGKKYLMHSKSNKIEILTNEKADEVTEELFASLLSRHQNCIEESMTGSIFFLDYIDLLHPKCHKTNWIRYRFFYLDKNKKTTINPVNKSDDKCLQSATPLELNHKEAGKNSGRT